MKSGFKTARQLRRPYTGWYCTEPMDQKAKSQLRDVIVCAMLAGAVFIAHRGVLDCNFVNWDDPMYVSENLRVQQGLNLDNIRWAFTIAFGTWTPLDTISHMADCQFFGLNPRGHHGANLAFHVANTVLLFLFLRSLTGSMWCSAFAAALFGVHPINASAVAWISSRKDVLSTFLGLLTLASYAYYALNPRLRRYVLVFVLFAFGLMAKPMLVTLPVICLLLDVWPLRRITRTTHSDETDDHDLGRSLFSTRPIATLLIEKVPLFGLSFVFSCVNFFTQRAIGNVMQSSSYPFLMRLENDLATKATYLLKMVWPFKFTVAYPYPGWDIPLWKVAGAAILIVAITAAAVMTIRSHGYIFTGWLWYLIALFPVSGIVVQMGSTAMPDRYAYLSLIGVYVMVVWGIANLTARWAPAGKAAAAAGVVLLAFLAVRTHTEEGYWRDSRTLWAHALEVTTDNVAAHASYGDALMKHGDFEEAASHFKEALRISPGFYVAQNSLGILLAMKGDVKGAEEMFAQALRVKPDYASAMCNLAKCRLEENRDAEAQRLFTEALQYISEYDPTRATVENAIRQLSSMERTQ